MLYTYAQSFKTPLERKTRSATGGGGPQGAPGLARWAALSVSGGLALGGWPCSGCPHSSTLETAPLSAVGHRPASLEGLQVPLPGEKDDSPRGPGEGRVPQA